MAIGISDVRARLWALARDEETLARAAHALYGRPPDTEEWAEFLDFVVTEWIDGRGRTLAESLAAEAGLADLAAWPTGVHTALFVVDGHEGDAVLLRDLADDREVAVRVSTEIAAELPRRTVLKARVVPWEGGMEFFGDPGLYGVHGVLSRLQLLQQWRESPEPSLLLALAQRRADYARQRDQRRVFLNHFGVELVIFADAEAMESALDTFFDHLLTVDRGPDGTRPTRAATRQAQSGKSPERVQLRLGDTLREGRPALLFDEAEGALFLPSFGELRDHLHGAANHHAVLSLWLTTPELPRLALRHAGPTARIAEHLGLADAPLDDLLGPEPRTQDRGPSLLPEFEDN